MKSGFVYLWLDKKEMKFYLGSHYGSEHDGYICGSKRMLKHYRVRPSDFKRRILVRATVSCHRELKELEQRYLDLIEPWEYGTRYYNFSARASGADPARASEWMKGNKNNLGKTLSESARQKISAFHRGRPQPEWLKKKSGLAKRGRKWFTDGVAETLTKNPPDGWTSGRSPLIVSTRFKGTQTREHAAKISAGKLAANAKKRAELGYAHSPETRAKISATKRVRFETGTA